MKNKKNILATVFLFVFAAFAVTFDLVSKYLVQSNLPLKTRSAFLPGFLSFYFDTNYGGAWSILSGQQVLLSIVTILFLFVFLWYFFTKRRKSTLFAIGSGLVIGGAIGNLFDRLVFGYVRDFLSFDFFSFPTFNVADSCICIGVALLLIYFVFLYGRECKQDAEMLKKQNGSLVAEEPTFDDLDKCERKFSLMGFLSQLRKNRKKQKNGEKDD